ncbi:MAG TPA: molybdopterin-dependent oxidoreductase [Candidatus Didemnitutus sp.]|jgi:hypothetical protein
MRALRILAWSLVLLTARVGLVAADAEIKVTGPAGTTAYTVSSLAAFSQSECTVTDRHSQEAAKYAGVAVRELLLKAGMPDGEAFRGRILRQAVQVQCADGYMVVFALADFDPAFSDRIIILALRRDGAPLSAKAGPFQLIVPGDKRPARWARNVTAITIVPLGDPPAAAHP